MTEIMRLSITITFTICFRSFSYFFHKFIIVITWFTPTCPCNTTCICRICKSFSTTLTFIFFVCGATTRSNSYQYKNDNYNSYNCIDFPIFHYIFLPLKFMVTIIALIFTYNLVCCKCTPKSN